MDNLELFDDVSVSLNDVELWLRAVPRLNDDARANHVQDYIKNYDVVNKIIAAKHDSSFYCLNESTYIDNEIYQPTLSNSLNQNSCWVALISPLVCLKSAVYL
jgi:hypothetical protein